MATQLATSAPLLLSFSGIDGAGKSTQIKMLTDRLAAAGLRVRHLAFWDDVATFTSLREFASCKVFKSEKGVGAPDNPVARRDKNVQTWYMTLVRYLICSFDNLSLMVSIFRARQEEADVVIFDRYLYDELANLSLRNVLTCAFVRFLLRLCPSPHIAYLLDADPDNARKRKPEYPLEFLWKNRANYLRVAKLAKMTVIEPGPVDEVSMTIVRKVSELRPSLQLDAQESQMEPVQR